jgi:hypothetical protein
MHKSADPDSIRVHCLEIYEFLELIQHFQDGEGNELLLEPMLPVHHDRRVSKASLVEEKQLQLQMFSRWSALKDKTLKSHPCEVERLLLLPVISDI